MVLFGHAGITLGAAMLLTRTLTCGRFSHSKGTEVIKPCWRSSQTGSTSNYSKSDKASWLNSFANHVDIRLLLIGSLLPDIIDKPLGTFLFRDSLSNGRIYCHTLLFLILITLVGLFLYRYCSKTWFLVLSFGTFTHLLLDQMWLTPRTLLWPLYGFSFEKIDLTYWMQVMFYALLTNPTVYIPEFVGAAIVICFVWLLARRGKLYTFFRNGQI